MNVATLSSTAEKYKDRWARINNGLYWIQDEKGKRVRFKLNRCQIELEDNLWWLNLVLKSRQHGITTWACIRGLDMAIFKPGSRVGVVAHTKDDATKFFRSKILYAYDLLDEEVKRLAGGIVRRDMNGTLEFGNGSVIEVSVSHRGGTFQYLHISEYGPMCAASPLRADEVKAGALNTVHEGSIVTIESTAYGREGDFAARSMRAEAKNKLVSDGLETLSRMDYRFFFFPWFDDPKNVLDDDVYISEAEEKYFLEVEGIADTKLSSSQRAWYVKKSEDQGDKMMQEHPSTPEEAFRASREGAYYAQQMAKVRKEKRITRIPILPDFPVDTFWDLGRNDSNAIWFMQHVGMEIRLIAYYQNSGKDITHYSKYLREFKEEHEIAFGNHYLPHDVSVVELTREDGKSRQEVLEDTGVAPIVVVPKINNLWEGIDSMRRMFPQLWFDVERCKEGIIHMDNYQKIWNKQTQSWTDSPMKNDARNGADAIRQMAQGYEGKKKPPRKKRKKRSWRTS